MSIYKLTSILALAGLLAGCALLKRGPAVGCPDSAVNDWAFPPSHLTESLNPVEAEKKIKEDLNIQSIGELVKDPITRSQGLKWMKLKNIYFEDGKSELWRLSSPPKALGAKGIVLIKDCDMAQVYITLQS